MKNTDHCYHPYIQINIKVDTPILSDTENDIIITLYKFTKHLNAERADKAQNKLSPLACL
jgi:hypothetical protein